MFEALAWGCQLQTPHVHKRSRLQHTGPGMHLPSPRNLPSLEHPTQGLDLESHVQTAVVQRTNWHPIAHPIASNH